MCHLVQSSRQPYEEGEYDDIHFTDEEWIQRVKQPAHGYTGMTSKR